MSRYLTDCCSSTLIEERKCKKETMITGYYIHERIGELEAVERWENEGGRLSQNHDYVLDATGEDYLRLAGPNANWWDEV